MKLLKLVLLIYNNTTGPQKSIQRGQHSPAFLGGREADTWYIIPFNESGLVCIWSRTFYIQSHDDGDSSIRQFIDLHSSSCQRPRLSLRTRSWSWAPFVTCQIILDFSSFRCLLQRKNRTFRFPSPTLVCLYFWYWTTWTAHWAEAASPELGVTVISQSGHQAHRDWQHPSGLLSSNYLKW